MIRVLIAASLLSGCCVFDQPQFQEVFAACQAICSPAGVLRVGYWHPDSCECYHPDKAADTVP